MKTTLYTAAFLCLLNQGIAEASSTNWQQQVKKLIATEVASTGIPSLQIAIGKDDAVIFEYAHALANIENNVVATSNTKYRIASISKWMTATAAMALVEKNKLNLDAPIQSYCPQFPEKNWQITTRHLLTHTSGIRHYADYHTQLKEAKTDEEKLEVKQRQAKSLLGRFTRYTNMHAPLENFKNDALLFKPGTDWQYTSFGYRVLGCVLEGAAKLSYRELMQSLVLSPANMSNTVDDDAWTIVPNRSAGYRIDREKNLRRANMRDISENLPAGGHLSTATDLVKFSLAFNNNKLVNETSKQTMISPLNQTIQQMYRTPIWRDAMPSQQNYSHGVMLFPDTHKLNIGHSGRQAGADAMVVLNPKDNLAIAILSNVKGYNGELKLIEKIEAIILAK